MNIYRKKDPQKQSIWFYKTDYIIRKKKRKHNYVDIYRSW